MTRYAVLIGEERTKMNPKVQELDGLTVSEVLVGQCRWHIWIRNDTGGQVHASMGDRVWVNGPMREGGYILVDGRWYAEEN